METRIRKHLERATRVAEFSREYPAGTPGYEAALDRLEERLRRADALTERFTGSMLARRAVIVERQQLRGSIAAGLQLLAGIARTAGQEAIGTPIIIRYPGPKQNQHEFLRGARLAVTTAREHQALLLKFGLSADHLDRLDTELNEFERLLQRRNEAMRTHVAARSEIQSLMKEVLMVVRQLHSINKYRFRQDPAALAAWVHSADIRIGSRKPAIGPAGDTPLALPAGEDSMRRPGA